MQGVADRPEMVWRKLQIGCNGGALFWTAQAEKRTKLWQARHECLLGPSLDCVAGCQGYLNGCLCADFPSRGMQSRKTFRDIEEMGFVAPMVGHAGDRNFHVLVLWYG